MHIGEIHEGVSYGIMRWSKSAELAGGGFRLTSGAEQLIVQMLVNIEEDPSAYWQEIDPDRIQRYVIEILPNILAEVDRPTRRKNREHRPMSSWEILHNISRALNKWCPIPKDI